GQAGAGQPARRAIVMDPVEAKPYQKEMASIRKFYFAYFIESGITTLTRGRAMPDTSHVPLYEPTLEHDGCGVGFIADLKGRPRRDVVVHALAALRRLTHRGAPASLGAVDGCGV